LSRVEILEQRFQEQQLLSHLKHSYQPATRLRQEQIKADLFETIRERSQLSWKDDLRITFVLLSRKMVAVSFILLLLLPALFGPLQSLQLPGLLPVARAAYIECSGEVFLNDHSCSNGEFSVVSVGDSIRTGQGSFATIFFSDFTMARLTDATRAVVDDLHQQQLRLIEGGVWLHTRGVVGKDSLQVSTPFIKALVSQGAAGMVTKGSLTQLFSTTAAVEVQIDRSVGTTEVLTLAPEKKLTVRKTFTSARVNETAFDSSKFSWVQKNTQKDAAYLADAKMKATQDKVVDTDHRTVSDYVDRATQSALTAFTWDSKSDFRKQLSDLNQLFDQTLVLLNKGDKTTAEDNFEAYRRKFISLVQLSSDTISIENSDQDKKLLLDVLQHHSQVVSPFSPDEPQYALKHALQQLTLDLDTRQLGDTDAHLMIADVATKKLMEAQDASLQGKLDIAKNMLADVLALVDQSPSSLSVAPADLAILDAIADKSPDLSPLVDEIKARKVEQLRAMAPEQESMAVSVVGKALEHDDSL